MSRRSRRWLVAAVVILTGFLPVRELDFDSDPPGALVSATAACATHGTGRSAGATKSSRFLWPVRGTVVRPFGERPDGVGSNGLDIRAAEGAAVLAAQAGTVAYAGNKLPGYGNLLLITHAQGFTTVYARNRKLLVGPGEHGCLGQPVAVVSRSDALLEPVLHFQIRAGVRPIDPVMLLQRGEDAIAAANPARMARVAAE
jgi:murein DD-endopeptidase MepM/ murein hydrolase activator NlpD